MTRILTSKKDGNVLGCIGNRKGFFCRCRNGHRFVVSGFGFVVGFSVIPIVDGIVIVADSGMRVTDQESGL